MLQLKTRRVTILTDAQTDLVAGGATAKTVVPKSPDVAPTNAGPCVSVECQSHECVSIDCQSTDCESLNCQSDACVSEDCASDNCVTIGCASISCD